MTRCGATEDPALLFQAPGVEGYRYVAGCKMTLLTAPVITYPYEISGNCAGKDGENSLVFVAPSGITRARYSPEPLSLKLVCNGAPGTRRSLFEAKTTIKVPGEMLVDGNCHWVRLVDLFERYHPAKFKVLLPEL